MGFDFAGHGFKCGIEVHQRLDSKKLFCECYCDPGKPSPEGRKAVLRRRLRAVAGELGWLDPAAAFEAERGKEFTYYADSNSSCLVEADEEPPHACRSEALETALQAALLLNARPVDEVHFMRKTVVDGSAVSGFQRTALIATDGWIDTSKGRVGIPTVCLEEEAAGIIERKAGTAEYRLDRLGIPLVEIASDSSIKDGEHCREVAEKIGLLLRSSGRVQRGIGTIRQDVNVSIREGGRVEIKGAQELACLPALVENEARRQLAFAELRKELSARARPAQQVHAVDLTHVFAATKCNFVSRALAAGGMVVGVRLQGFAGLLSREVMPGHRFGTELSDYAKAFAGVGGIIHSDESMQKYSFSEAEVAAVRKILDCSESDAFVLCVAQEFDAVRALGAVFERAMQAFEGLPSETRKAEGEKSVFMRPLPGAGRMYPETDVPPIRLTPAFVKSVKLPETFEEKRGKYLEAGLNKELADKVLRESDSAAFEDYCSTGASPTFVATILVETMKSLKRDGVPTEKIEASQLKQFFSAFAEGLFVKAAAPLILAELALKPNASVSSVVEAKGLKKFGAAQLSEVISFLQKQGFYGERLLGEAMRRHRLNIDAAELRRALSRKEDAAQ